MIICRSILEAKRLFFIILILFSSGVNAKEIFSISSLGSASTYIPEKIMREVYAKLGISIKITKLPAARSIETANSEVAGAELARIKVDPYEYPNLVRVPVAIDTIEGVVFSKYEHFKVNGWDSLRPYKIGIRRGVKFTEKGTKGMGVMLANSNKQLLLMLAKGRVDVVVLNRRNAAYELEQSEFQGIISLSPSVHYLEVFHYLHVTNRYLLPRLGKALKKMRKSGEMDRIAGQALVKTMKR